VDEAVAPARMRASQSPSSWITSAVILGWLPAWLGTLRARASMGCSASRAQRSMVLALIWKASPVVGCGQDRAARVAMLEASSPGLGGAVSSGATTPKRNLAQRERAGGLDASPIVISSRAPVSWALP
jgi:hypothetical protein